MDKTRYYRLPNGDLATVTVSAGITYDYPEGAVPLSEEEYTPLLAEAATRQAEQVATLEAADAVRGQTVYSALVSSGISPDVAQILSGYTPPGRPG
ncbi:hypothetical protein [Streptomyces sp. AGS-58]|uniref:hypothetical protein n=1 Tax=unclassified Streptomyces TaxID=2593676 RepID=UPI0035A2A634